MADVEPTSPLTRILASMDPAVRRELPMPSATKAGNIEQAQATLFLCSIKLRGRIELWAQRSGSNFVAEGHAFRTWLESWETAFSALLSNAMPSMHQDDVDRCRVIKANHLSCIVLAALLESNPGARRANVDKDCLAIVGLATAVLDGHTSHSSRASKSAMTMAEPLVIVQSYASSTELRNHAAHLLARHYNVQETQQPASTSPASSVATSSPRSVLSQSFGHSRTSSQGRYSG
ncbi:hypothetical protein AMS68_004939 [Peltaster fructicola]|uniref:Uncharacterized protein n=1 Tax=Peltaster fructicola TaxID=286661 RepID=A0A6H0XXC1_9PEZI|nr:hypothetical protein AMS68_004939 [Peltaster fructicola]